MKKEVIGKCGMCLRLNSRLQRSHMFPAAAYKRLRNPESKNPNPVWCTSEFVIQTSSQIQDHFLCWDCEQRLRTNGEDWGMRVCWQPDNTFPLQAALQNYAPEMTSKLSKLYAASRIKEVKIEKLAYFAASVFWRASAHDWRKGVRSSDRGFLGGYEEDFRMYLMGQQDFPIHAALRVAVPETIDSAFHSGVIEPCRGVHEPTCEHYQFLFLGIGFDLFVGKTMHDHFRKHCFVRGDLIAMTQILDHGIDFKWKRLAKGREIGGY